jgi:hypothetical protein
MAPTTEETSAKLDAAKASLAEAQAAHDAAEKEAQGPRAPAVIIDELLTSIVAHFGNRPEMEKLLKELKAATAPEEPPPAEPAH